MLTPRIILLFPLWSVSFPRVTATNCLIKFNSTKILSQILTCQISIYKIEQKVFFLFSTIVTVSQSSLKTISRCMAIISSQNWIEFFKNKTQFVNLNIKKNTWKICFSIYIQQWRCINDTFKILINENKMILKFWQFKIC